MSQIDTWKAEGKCSPGDTLFIQPSKFTNRILKPRNLMVPEDSFMILVYGPDNKEKFSHIFYNIKLFPCEANKLHRWVVE